MPCDSLARNGKTLAGRLIGLIDKLSTARHHLKPATVPIIRPSIAQSVFVSVLVIATVVVVDDDDYNNDDDDEDEEKTVQPTDWSKTKCEMHLMARTKVIVFH